MDLGLKIITPELRGLERPEPGRLELRGLERPEPGRQVLAQPRRLVQMQQVQRQVTRIRFCYIPFFSQQQRLLSGLYVLQEESTDKKFIYDSRLKNIP